MMRPTPLSTVMGFAPRVLPWPETTAHDVNVATVARASTAKTVTRELDTVRRRLLVRFDLSETGKFVFMLGEVSFGD